MRLELLVEWRIEMGAKPPERIWEWGNLGCVGECLWLCPGVMGDVLLVGTWLGRYGEETVPWLRIGGAIVPVYSLWSGWCRRRSGVSFGRLVTAKDPE